jgi:PAS domain S-box-containing protein
MQRKLIQVIMICCYAVCAFCFYQAVQWVDKPFPGFLTFKYPTIGSFGMSTWTGQQAGLKSYVDNIVSVNGEHIYSNADVYEKVASVPEGTAMSYGVVRGGDEPEIRQILVPTMRFGLKDFIYCFVTTFLFGIIMLSLGTLTGLYSQDKVVGLTFLGMCIAIGMYGATGFEIQSSALLMPLHLLFLDLVPGFLLLFALHWPVKKGFIQKYRWLNLVALIPSAGIYVFKLWVYFTVLGKNFALNSNALFWAEMLMRSMSLNFVLLLSAFLFLLWNTLSHHRKNRDDSIKRQTRIALIGLVTVVVAMTFIFLMSMGISPIPLNLLPLVAIVFPASISYSILRHRMFGIAVISRKSFSEERYRLLVEQSLTGICIVQDEIIRFANDRLGNMLGYTLEELTDMSVLNLIHPEDKALVREAIGLRVAGGDPTGYLEFRGMTKSGDTKWMETLGPDILFEGKPAMFINIIDATERKRIEQELKQHQEELEGLVAKRTEKLNEAQEQLRSLSMHLQLLREEERAKIAREIHDDLGQTLTVLKMDTAWLSKHLPEDQEALLEKTKAMSSRLDSTIQSIKKLYTELRPGLLDDFGLADAIEWHAEDFQKHTEIECETTVTPKDLSLSGECSTAIFRIFQEALTNVVRHAQATKITAKLETTDGHIVLTVRDNGKGIDQDDVSKAGAFGLMGIRERAHSLGGTMEISGVGGTGTTIAVTIPIDD